MRPLAPAPRPASDAARAGCEECGGEGDGAFCPGCGRPLRPERLTLSLLVQGLAEQMSLERGLLRTVRDMTVRPGAVIRGYLSGERRRWTSPFAYFFSGAAAALLAYSLHREQVADVIRRRVEATASGAHPVFSAEQAAVFRELLLEVVQQPAYRGLVMCVPFALAIRFLFRREEINLAEALVLSLYALGHAFLLHALVVAPVLGAASDVGAYLWLGAVPYLLATCGAVAGTFGRPFRSVPRALAALAVAFGTFVLLVAASATGYVLLLVPGT